MMIFYLLGPRDRFRELRSEDDRDVLICEEEIEKLGFFLFILFLL